VDEAAADVRSHLRPRGLSEPEFEELYSEQVSRVFSFLARRVGADLAEDLTAQVFVEAWAGRDRYDPDHGVAAGWIFGIATNLLRRHHRHEETQLRAYARLGEDPVAAFDESAVVERVMVRDGWKHVAAALADLSDDDRDVLTLAGWAKLSYIELAAALGVPTGTVKSRLSRARTQLTRRLSSSIDLT
jgi:RNA polymerase sigma-70 factor (ECF subfamily)